MALMSAWPMINTDKRVCLCVCVCVCACARVRVSVCLERALKSTSVFNLKA